MYQCGLENFDVLCFTLLCLVFDIETNRKHRFLFRETLRLSMSIRGAGFNHCSQHVCTSLPEAPERKVPFSFKKFPLNVGIELSSMLQNRNVE
jgi:hypothetical protein